MSQDRSVTNDSLDTDHKTSGHSDTLDRPGRS